MANNQGNEDFGRMLRQQRVLMMLTIRKLSALSGVSSSHLSRIEKGQRFPSASVLRRIAGPLGLDESELFSFAGYLSPESLGVREKGLDYSSGQLDPYVARMLSQEPVEVQRAVIGLLSILKSMAGTTGRTSDDS